jgi:hypothetical protein
MPLGCDRSSAQAIRDENLKPVIGLNAPNLGLWSRQHDGHDTTASVHFPARGVQRGFAWSSLRPGVASPRTPASGPSKEARHLRRDHQRAFRRSR